MTPNENLERLSLVLIGVVVGVLIGSVTERNQVTPYDILIIVIFLLILTAFLRDVAYRRGNE